MYEVIIEESAAVEIEEIYFWYEDKLPGLGERFKEDFQDIVYKLSVYPNSYSFITKLHRRATLKTFPYFIIYRVIQLTVIVFCVIYAGRNLKDLQSEW
jgi:plasmid stabilization system protein ParE